MSANAEVYICYEGMSNDMAVNLWLSCLYDIANDRVRNPANG